MLNTRFTIVTQIIQGNLMFKTQAHIFFYYVLKNKWPDHRTHIFKMSGLMFMYVLFACTRFQFQESHSVVTEYR